MSYLNEGLHAWAGDMLAVRLPRWSELPDFDLYMDQVISIVNDHLSFLAIDDSSNILTPAMVNNYVKSKVIPKPEKKRYNRTHLAFLFVIVSLKPIISISDIREGIRMQIAAFRGNLQSAYDLFCKQLEKNLHSIARVAQNKGDETQLLHHLPVGMRGIYMITYSLASKLYAKKVLQIEREHWAQSSDDVSDLR